MRGQTSDGIRLTIPGVAASKGNSYRIVGTRLVRGKRWSGSTDSVAFDDAVLAEMVRAKLRPIAGPVEVEAIVYPPDRRRDTAGVEKVLLDALQSWRRVKGRRSPNPFGAGCYENDKQVGRFVAEFGGVDATNPRVVVTVQPWRAAAAAQLLASTAAPAPRKARPPHPRPARGTAHE